MKKETMLPAVIVDIPSSREMMGMDRPPQPMLMNPQGPRSPLQIQPQPRVSLQKFHWHVRPPERDY